MRVPASVNAALVLVAVDRFEYFDGLVDASRDRVGVDVDLSRFEIAASVGVEVDTIAVLIVLFPFDERLAVGLVPPSPCLGCPLGGARRAVGQLKCPAGMARVLAHGGASRCGQGDATRRGLS